MMRLKRAFRAQVIPIGLLQAGQPVIRRAGLAYASLFKTMNESVKVLSFENALNIAESKGKRHLLMGNGFSLALNPKLFNYGSLLDEATESGKLQGELRKTFDELNTTDFEVVMRNIRNAAQLVELYEPANLLLVNKLKEDEKNLQRILVDTITQRHPALPTDIKDTEYESCISFLGNFNGTKYSLNYDLLLYWTYMKAEGRLNCRDGFREPEEGDTNYVEWDLGSSHDCDIVYLHGALHLFDTGQRVKKLTWSRTHVPLHTQITSALADGEYPVIVSEGEYEQKRERILHNAYLARSFSSFCNKAAGSLFAYGVAFKDNDEHIRHAIAYGRIKELFIGLYGDCNAPENQQIIHEANRIASLRELLNQKRAAQNYRLRQSSGSAKGTKREVGMNLHYFDASSARVWR
ncbi:MAG: DUF4917 family protein [Planctomycetales bacterium]|nr:MAG: DUF4917 family protein [Planctomycetales bacterium]